MKYSHFLCTLERNNQEKLKMAILQLKCVPCLNKFTTTLTSPTPQSLTKSGSSQSMFANSSKNSVSHANMTRLLKQMSLIVSTELQQIAIDLFERMDEDKPVKLIRLKDEFRQHGIPRSLSHSNSTSSCFKQPQKCTLNASSSFMNQINSTNNSSSSQMVSQKNTTSFIPKTNSSYQLSNIVKQRPSSPSIDVNQMCDSNSNNINSSKINQSSSVNKFLPILNPHLNLKLITDKLQDLNAFSSFDRNYFNMDRS